MGQPHKHAEIIHAFADGAQVEYMNAGGEWVLAYYPDFDPEIEYRIKPEPPKYPQTRMTEKERWDSIRAAGIGLFNIGTSREKGADRLEHSPGDVTAAIANAAIARAIEDGDVVPAAMLEKVAEVIVDALAKHTADRYPGPGGYPLSDNEKESITLDQIKRLTPIVQSLIEKAKGGV